MHDRYLNFSKGPVFFVCLFFNGLVHYYQLKKTIQLVSFDSSLRNLKIWGTESLYWLLKKPKFGKREKAKLFSFLLCFQSPIIFSVSSNFVVVKPQSPLSVPSVKWFPVPFYTIYYSPLWKLLSWAFGMSHPCSFILCLCSLYSRLMESSFIFLFFVGTLWFLAHCFFLFVIGRSVWQVVGMFCWYYTEFKEILR